MIVPVQTMSAKQFELYFRTILICEYFADLFASETRNNNGYILFSMPLIESPIGRLLAIFFTIRKKQDEFKYTGA